MSGGEWSFAQNMALERMSGALSIEDLVDEIALRGPHHNLRAVTVHANAAGRISLARRRRCDPWDDEQNDVLRESAGKLTTVEIAAEIRRRLCWLRTPRAVAMQALRLGLSLDVVTLSLRDVTALLGVRRVTVRGWVECAYLRPVRKPDAGVRGPWRFCREDVLDFVRSHPHLVHWQQISDREIRMAAREATLRTTWLSVAHAARVLGVCQRSVTLLLAAGAFEGAFKVGRSWRVPASSVSDVARSRRELRAAS